MNALDTEDFFRRFHDRTVRYGAHPLEPGVRVAIDADPSFLATLPGQTAIIVATDLACRLARRSVLAFPDFEFDPRFGGPFSGSAHEVLISRMKNVAPPGEFSAGGVTTADYVIRFGAKGESWVVDGSDWNLYVGPSPSPLPVANTENIFGACLAAITAIARVFGHQLPRGLEAQLANLLTMRPEVERRFEHLERGAHLGELWLVGCGSVGSAIAYFLTLAGYRFDATLFDRDPVELENVSRSPIFLPSHEGDSKALIVKHHLAEFGISARAEQVWLHESGVWTARAVGAPDLILSAANEHEVRYQIESQFPCPQVYGTTGKNWSSNVFRHVPPEPCSCCAFPPTHKQTACATGQAPAATGVTKQVDAALPFLSFAAGLLAAAEVSKMSLTGFPMSAQRGFFEPLGDSLLYSTPLQHRSRCICTDRSNTVHQKVLQNSRYASLCF